MSQTQVRFQLRRGLKAHLDALGYTADRVMTRVGAPPAEIARISPVRGRLVYGQTILATDLTNPRCHERLTYFAHRRTKRRSQIMLFIAVEETHQAALEQLLVDLGIRSAVRGGHVQVIAFASAPPPRARTTSGARRSKPSSDTVDRRSSRS
ncbi:MAG: hypothetical protein AB7V27_07380 [Candidatus Binatia bacterium]